MKAKILNVLLIITSLLGYLEWGKDNQAFLFEAEREVFLKLLNDPGTVLHPFTIFPIIGQFILLITLFQKNPTRILTYTGLACVGLLLFMMFVIGLISLNMKILISTIPFLFIAFLAIVNTKKFKSSDEKYKD